MILDFATSSSKPGTNGHREIVTEAELLAHGLTRTDIRRRCPLATEFAGLAGERCWRLEDLLPLLPKGGESP
jgi:hypothetical protein